MFTRTLQTLKNSSDFVDGFTTKKDVNGADVVTKRNVPAYSVVELPPLTAQELKDLADLQARTNALEDA